MGLLKSFAALSAVTMLLLANHLYSTVPEDLEDPWLAKTYIAAFKFANLMAEFLSMITGISSVDLLRWQLEMLYDSNFEDPEILVENHNFDGIPVRLYRSKLTTDVSPALVYIHGGGWTLFTLDSYNLVCSQLALHTNTVVISVSYRRSPESAYPVPFDDCLKATLYVLHNGRRYGVDPARVAVAGDGTGANLAAAVAFRLSEEDPEYTPFVKLQILLQPAMQAFTFDTPSYRQNAKDTLVGRRAMIEFWCHYLGVHASSDTISALERNEHITPTIKRAIYSLYTSENLLPQLVKTHYTPSNLDRYTTAYSDEISKVVESKVIDPFMSPLLADDLSKSSPVFILVAEYDVLRDDGLLFASRLKEANVSVTVKYVGNQSHGFLAPLSLSEHARFTSTNKTWADVYEFIKLNL
ncbi:arylacetamide deacetylase-like [Physella acuta]|uniref:arylacetamide deacetylase-like n=1 Tax=Physella acuta TaxID=109671 RepID=UPI0027DBC721|nr:arylacetamide deacetylase-like [Physella acuta]